MPTSLVDLDRDVQHATYRPSRVRVVPRCDDHAGEGTAAYGQWNPDRDPYHPGKILRDTRHACVSIGKPALAPAAHRRSRNCVSFDVRFRERLRRLADRSRSARKFLAVFNLL